MMTDIEIIVTELPQIEVTVAEQGPPGTSTTIASAPDVSIHDLSNSDLLIYNATTEKWENKKLTSYIGKISHEGLIPTEGFDIDQIKTISVTIPLLAEWQDVPSINSNILASGTYIIQLYANDKNDGGTNDHEYYSGVMSWYDGSTTSLSTTDEILLHRAGSSTNDNDAGLFLRTCRTSTNLKLQIFSNYSNITECEYVFKFRRMI